MVSHEQQRPLVRSQFARRNSVMPNKVSETVSLKPQSMYGACPPTAGPIIATHLVGEQALSVRPSAHYCLVCTLSFLTCWVLISPLGTFSDLLLWPFINRIISRIICWQRRQSQPLPDCWLIWTTLSLGKRAIELPLARPSAIQCNSLPNWSPLACVEWQIIWRWPIKVSSGSSSCMPFPSPCLFRFHSFSYLNPGSIVCVLPLAVCTWHAQLCLPNVRWPQW